MEVAKQSVDIFLASVFLIPRAINRINHSEFEDFPFGLAITFFQDVKFSLIMNCGNVKVLKLKNEVLKFMHKMHIKIKGVLHHLLFTNVSFKHECASAEECWFVYKSAKLRLLSVWAGPSGACDCTAVCFLASWKNFKKFKYCLNLNKFLVLFYFKLWKWQIIAKNLNLGLLKD